MKESFLSVKGRFENVTVIEKSRFVCYLKNTDGEAEAKAFIEEIRKKNSLATHNCYAYIADEYGRAEKFSDDGEPQGTAGVPMLEALKNNRLFKVTAVVTRYFGGIKLGAGGLVRAYSGAVSECIKTAAVVSHEYCAVSRIVTDYDGYGKLLKLLQNPDVIILKTEFAEKISVEFAVKDSKFENLKNCVSDAFSGKLVPEICARDYYVF